MKKGGLGITDMAADVSVTGCLAALFFEVKELRVERDEHVVQAVQVGFGAAQAQLGLVAPRVKAGDAGGLFQDGTPFRRLGGDDRPDSALVDQGRRPRPGGRVGEQELHVVGPYFLAVYAVGGALFALDTPADLEVVGIVELGGGGSGMVVDIENDLADIARWPVFGAAEDDVVHLEAAHFLGRGLAHDPAQGVDQVGFAAAVGADDARQPLLDEQIGALDEGLETRETQLGELHRYRIP